jgi:nicotinate-nucleotide pyrophosphorylase (carboxylating)
VRRATPVLVVRGNARKLLGAERSILNVLMHASGVATATARAVRTVRDARPRLEVWATRKTLPGLRALEKAAVVHGGGRPHRASLADAVLVKNNHLVFATVGEAVRRARARAGPARRVEIEVRSRTEALAAARAGADALLLDNRTPREARAIVRALERAGWRRRLWVEISGGLTPATLGRYRRVGANAASLGSLTHSAAALPFRMRVRPLRLSRPSP